MKQRCRVSPDALRRTWDPEQLGVVHTGQLSDLKGLVGQNRAVRALEFGLAIKAPGYNIYVAGPTGTGKTSYTRSLVTRRAAQEPTPEDWVYVHNFDRPDEPQALSLPPGKGPVFARDVEELLSDARSAVVRALESREHLEQRETLVRQAKERMSQVVAELEQEAKRQGFVVAKTDHGFVPIPVVQGQPLSPQELSQLSREQQRQIAARSEEIQEIITDAGRTLWELEKTVDQGLRELDRRVTQAALGPVVERIQSRYTGLERVVAWLDRVRSELVAQLPRWLLNGDGEGAPAAEPSGTETEHPAGAPAAAAHRRSRRPDPLSRFRVNVFVARDPRQGAPVVVETNPTYTNLVGKVEYAGGREGTFNTDVTRIKAGALHRANGGYLILQAHDLLQTPFAWDALKRVLTNQAVRIEPAGQELRLVPLETLRPEPVPLNIKVILIGNPGIYHLLYSGDETFRKLFKLKAEFDVVMPANKENVAGYAHFIAQVCRRDGLRHLDAGAVAQVLEHSHRLAEDQQKLSARFNAIVELIYEANAWAEAEGAKLVTARHVATALREKAARSGLAEVRTRELIEREVILVDVAGQVVGQVNGLTVMHLGDYRFGSPSRITARTHMGQKGILHIEREIQMSGSIHDKGVLTLAGFLGDRFAQDKPLALSASIAFEQTYVPVDGDSASSTELYALLSSLAGVPIDQGIAVTGSVNQRGQVQPIGGVNEKIEGWYQVCKARGFTGRQGVLIPRQNLHNLALDPEVVAAVQEGRFHIWAVGTVEEGIEILTGMPAGEPLPGGGYTPGSLFDRVDRRLRELAESLARFGREQD